MSYDSCPMCGGPMHPELVMNALSRRDNATYICSDCGTKEALSDFFGRVTWGRNDTSGATPNA